MALPLRMIVAGGGTGGHVFPGIALADAFLSLCPDGAVSFVGTRGRSRGAGRSGPGFPIDFVPSGQVRGKGIGALPGALRMALGFPGGGGIEAAPAGTDVFGVGGYASVPVALPAALLGIPLFLQEQNSVPGRSNRFWRGMRSGCSRAFRARSPSSLRVGRRSREPGPPGDRRGGAGARAGWPPETPFTVLALGGSQGARAINTRVLEMARRAKREGTAIRFLLQTGTREHEAVARSVRGGRPSRWSRFRSPISGSGIGSRAATPC